MTFDRSFVPWSLPLAAGLTAGVAAAASPWWPWLLLLAAGALLLGAWRAPGRRGLAAVALVGLVGGAARYAQWSQRPDPVRALLGSERVFAGRSDGRLLRLASAGHALVAVVPAGSLPAGEVRVRGVLERAEGRRNPGGFDYGAYLRRRGVAAQLFVEQVLAVEPRVPLVERFRRGVRAGLPPPRAALMEAMTLGVRDDLGDLRDSFAASGLAHVLSVSGLHLGVLVAALARLAAPLGRRRFPLLMAATLGYVLLVGASPSVLRACTMVLAALACLALGYARIEAWPALALAASVGLAIAPAQLFDASFQLSYLAVGGMLVFTGPFTRRLRSRHPGRGARLVVGGALAVSVAAQLPTLSLVASSFGGLPLLSPVVNLAAVPLAGVLVPLGFMASLLGLVWLPLAALLNQALSPLAGALLWLARIGASFPRLPWGEVSALGHVCFGTALIAIALVLHGRLRPWRGCLVVLTGLVLSAAVPPAHAPPEVVFLDVGQGDAGLVRLPGGVELLVDGGGSPFSDADVAGRVVLPALRSLGVGRLDVVVATHPDADHVEGLLRVLQEFEVGTLVLGIRAPDSALDARLRRIAAERGIPVHEARRGERWVFGRGRRQAVIEVLNPPHHSNGTTNDDSVAFLLRYGGVPQVLFLGDLAASVEAVLAVPPVPVLKVAHHGSRHSTPPALLRAARPRVAVISVGRNGYGHPDPGVVERLRGAGARVLTTQAHGAIRLPLSRRGPGPASPTVPRRGAVRPHPASPAGGHREAGDGA